MWGKQDPAHAQRLAEQGLSFGPPPAWIAERAIPEMPQDPQGSTQFLLSDSHIDLTSGRDWSYRMVQRALNADGVGRMANFTVAFEPSFERVTIHRVRILRGGQSIELADPDAFQLLRRETSLERRLYDGRLTADLQAPDLRPGDILDTWFTTHGVNPALRNALDARFSFEWSEPVGATAVRIRAPEARKFAIRSLPDTWTSPAYSETSPSEGIIEREWLETRKAIFRYDDAVPDWWNGHGRVEVADALSWAEIADIFRAAYAPPAETPAIVQTEVSRIAAAFASPADRTVAALRYVQREIRYLSVSIGEGGYVPRPIEDICARRFGDCKDVSRLLTTMLRALGIDAAPALVNTRVGEALDRAMPGVHWFDHCIVRARLDGKTYWLDGTFGEQGGDLGNLYQPQLGYALPLEDNARLEPIKGDDRFVHVLELTEDFVFGPKADSPAELRVEGVYRSWRADNLRGAIRRDGLDRHSEGWLKQYSRFYGGAVALEPPRITDDMSKNVLTLVERYRIEKPWEITNNVARFATIDDTFQRDLSVLPYPGRKQPLSLGIRRRMTRTTRLKLPVKWQVNAWSDLVKAPGIRGKSECYVGGDSRVTLDVDYEITQPHVDGSDLEEFNAGVEKLRGGVSVGLSHTVKNGAFVKSGSTYSGNRGAIIAVVVFIAALIFIRIVLANSGG
jgi:transglutaminase-like putative cysteine protease